MGYPRRIVCLTEESVETLYLLGEQDRIVGVSGYAVRPPEARSKPHVSAFMNANYDRILALEPDLVIGFSDVQAEVAKDLIKLGLNVVVFNQRSIDEILRTIVLTGALVGRADAAQELASSLRAQLGFPPLPVRPRVYFEEWPDPPVSGICWVSELIEICGGEDVCAETRTQKAASGRVFTPEEIERRAPDVIVASWCGKKVDKASIAARWPNVPAVRAGHVYEIESEYILQPGPASLTEGASRMRAILEHVAGEREPVEHVAGEPEDLSRSRRRRVGRSGSR